MENNLSCKNDLSFVKKIDLKNNIIEIEPGIKDFGNYEINCFGTMTTNNGLKFKVNKVLFLQIGIPEDFDKSLLETVNSTNSTDTFNSGFVVPNTTIGQNAYKEPEVKLNLRAGIVKISRNGLISIEFNNEMMIPTLATTNLTALK